MFPEYKFVNNNLFIVETTRIPAVLYFGAVEFLTEAQRISIIQGNGADFDVLPDSYDGPRYKETKTLVPVYLQRPRFAIKEWDGTINVVTIHPGEGEGMLYSEFMKYDFVDMEYADGLIHTVSFAYFKSIAQGVTFRH